MRYPVRHLRLVSMLITVLVAGACSPAGPVSSSTVATPSSSAAVTSSAPAVSPTATAPAVPSPSPSAAIQDGEPWILYQLYEGAFELHLVRPDGTGDHPVTSEQQGNQKHPDWSPDGQQIAFMVDNDIWIVGVDGADPHRLLACEAPCVFVDYPAWSPDGASIMFVRAESTDDTAPGSAVMAVDVATGTVRTLFETTGPVYASYPRWSPDGRSVVTGLQRFGSLQADDCVPIGTAIAIVDLGEPEPTPTAITDETLFGDYPDWSPDGTSIVFSTYDLGARDAGCFKDVKPPSDLYTIRPDGTGLTQVTHNPSGTTLVRNDTASGPLSSQPSWSPDGRSIIFVQTDRPTWPGWTMATISADGTGLAPATSSGFMKGTHPRMRPTP